MIVHRVRPSRACAIVTLNHLVGGLDFPFELERRLDEILGENRLSLAKTAFGLAGRTSVLV